MQEQFLPHFVERCTNSLLTGWLRSLRFRSTGFSAIPPAYILAIPHDSLFIAASYFRDRGMVTMASRSNDGDHITAVLDKLGYTVARGSSSRDGSTALRQMIRLTRETGLAALTVDGPRGPAGKPKPGVIALAQMTGLPILPMTAHARGMRLASWDNFLVPVPFARCTLNFGTPIRIAPDADRDTYVRHLERVLKNLAHPS